MTMNEAPRILITGARVVDGTGNSWFYGDIEITGDTISGVYPTGQAGQRAFDDVVDAAGLVVCPGFIDIQSHSIVPLMLDGRCLSKITQGVTTEIMGEAWTPAPFGGRIPEPFSQSFVARELPEWEERARGWRRFR